MERLFNCQEIYYAELTDTFAGEANYSWVTRFKVHARSRLGAIRMIARATGYRYRKQYDLGDMARYDSHSGATCVFLSDWDAQDEVYKVESI